MSDARGIDRRTAQRLSVALRKSEGDTGAPVAQSETRNQEQRILRVKIDTGETVTATTAGVGVLQLQKSDGSAWVDTTTKIPEIYLGTDGEPDLEAGDIAWIVSRQNKHYTIKNTSRLVLIKYTGTSCALGASETYGIEYEGDCEIWDHLVTGASTPSPIPTGTANARFLFGMILFPDQFCWARFTDGKYWVVSGGTAFFTGSLTDGGAGTATVSAQGVELDCTELCGVDLVAGQTVAVNVETQPLGSAGFDTRLIITRACCPDIDGD